MDNGLLLGVNTFLAVAECGSFTGAALRLGVSPTAVSKSIRAMEGRHGVLLFQRTTRQVALTEAGRLLAERLRPAAEDIAQAFTTMAGLRDRPTGILRITAPRSAADLLAAVVPAYRRACPEVTLDLSLNDALVDLIRDGYDAGIRLDEAVEKDMVAVRLTPRITWTVVGAPAYLDRAGRPQAPEDLVHHESIRYRFSASRALHRWEFRRGRRSFIVDVAGGLVVDDRRLLLELAAQGQGLAYVAEREARADLAAGRLQAMLHPYIPSNEGLYLYFPGQSQRQPKLRAFIDALRASTREALRPGDDASPTTSR
ncbi:LysR family transcriptional regulator [Ramlibacter tataouinensis]|uniref:Transcriptional regulator, LysR family-like protein n=1 Tax=Ramlibacter tataouinensis (strain ATCC BAA-407 / DSM 14655 / LMG 21543 / TTB310) TaxID=365046 RepID=F5Y3K1_RAMTT|nr:LysR family transcriptional regulator [Ramlibacter tataouinensis]AEG92475.1 transcriptional regulator, LysR family-like protein [Ramlibacter tataouinensis TTB310]